MGDIALQALPALQRVDLSAVSQANDQDHHSIAPPTPAALSTSHTPAASLHGDSRPPTPPLPSSASASGSAQVPRSGSQQGLSRSGSQHGFFDSSTAGSAAGAEDGPSAEDLATALPPVDRGRGAWTFVACSFTLEFILWGTMFASGIWQQYYIVEFAGRASAVSISAISTTLTAFSYVSGALFTPIYRRYAWRMKTIALAGLATCALSLLAASFTDNVNALIVLQGVGTGFGAGVAFGPALIILPQWFDKRRGMATGLIFSASTLGGISFPYLFEWALSTLGWRWSLRLYAGVVALCTPALVLMQPRIPVQRLRTDDLQTRRRSAAKNPRSYLKALVPHGLEFVSSPIYLLNAAIIFVLSAGYLSVSLYASTYIKAAGYSNTIATTGVAILNAAAAIGQLLVGFATDRLAYPLITVLCGSVCALSAIILWGFSTSVGAIVAFLLLYGGAAGGYSASWSASCRDVSRLRNVPGSSVMMSIYAVRGVASLIGPLIAAALLQREQAQQAAQHLAPARAVFGSYSYAALIIWVGSCMAATAALGAALQWCRKKTFKGVDYSAMQEVY